MLIYPAIDLIGGQAVRLLRGDYAKKTVVNADPLAAALDFKAKGAAQMHLVDLDGAKSGSTENLEVICRLKAETGLFCEVGGGIRSLETVEKYLAAGIDRVILGTGAVKDPAFLKQAAERFGSRIAVGIDSRDGFVAVSGWTEDSGLRTMDFCQRVQDLGIDTVICTDISKDGAMEGTNLQLYRQLSAEFHLNIIASGGISSLEDVRALREMNLAGAIIGKAYYTGAIDLAEAIEAAK